MLSSSLTRRLVIHAHPNDVTEGYAAAWALAQLREPAQKIADRIEVLTREPQTAQPTPPASLDLGSQGSSRRGLAVEAVIRAAHACAASSTCIYWGAALTRMSWRGPTDQQFDSSVAGGGHSGEHVDDKEPWCGRGRIASGRLESGVE